MPLRELKRSSKVNIITLYHAEINKNIGEMPGRRSKQRLTMRKSHRTTATSKYRQDEDGVTVLDDAKWKTLTPYGLCISMVLTLILS